MTNDFESCGDVTVIFAKGGGIAAEVLIDTGDLEFAQAIPTTWYLRDCGRGQPYVVAVYVRNRIKTTVYLHRLICKGDPTLEVDHINRDRFDNRKSNLRRVTRQINSFNTQMEGLPTKTGYCGVSKVAKGTWRAQILSRGNERQLGYFKSPEAAHAAYLQALRELETQLQMGAGE